METQIRRVRISNNFNIADMLYEAMFGRNHQDVRPMMRTKVTERTRTRTAFKVLENPAASQGLGWRRDA